MDLDEVQVVDNTKLRESTIQQVLSNPEFIQQLMSSQLGSSSDIQGLKIGDQILPIRIYEKDGKKTMQIALSENAFKDDTSEENEVLNIEMAADTSNQLLDTVDNYIDNFSLPNSLQSLSMPNVSLQDTGMDFVQSTQGFDNMLSPSGVYSVAESSYYNSTPSIGTEVQGQTLSVEYSNEDNIKIEPVDFSTTSFNTQKYESILPSSSQHIAAPPEDIVAAAFHESGILQATTNAIQAAKLQYKDKFPKKKPTYNMGMRSLLSPNYATTPGKVLFTCNYGNCRRKFQNRTGLDIHLYSHTGLKPVTCKLCEKSFLSTKLFDKHKCKFNRPLQEMKGVQFNCDLCNKCFGNLGTLVVHKRSHRGSKPYTCGLCAKAFTLKSSMYKHVKSHGSDVRYKCQTCEEMFRSPWHLEEHLMSHMNEKKVYNCSQCTKIYTNYTHYIRHVKSHSMKGKHGDLDIPDTQILKGMNISDGLKCNVCFKVFTSVSGFQQHMQVHGPKRFKCSECSKCFASKDYLQNHLQWYIAKFVLGTSDPGHTKVIEKYKVSNDLDVNDFLEILEHEDIENFLTQEEESNMEDNDDFNKTYLCDICGNYFFSERALKLHIKFHDNIPYKCSHCDKKFSFRSNLIRHELTHTEPKDFHCGLCDKSFSRQSLLDDHYISHSSVKQYPCNVCNKKFSRISNLRRHKQLHALEKRYKCPECEKGFVCARYLKEHVQNVHTSMGRKKQECPICKMELSGSSNLNRHLNLHYGTQEQNKKLECEVCKKKFEFKSDMDVHMRSHTGEKPFTCEKCDKGFMSMSNLRRHYITHMETKAHVCEVCGKAFKIERYLLDHKKIHTNPTKVTCDVCGLSFSSNTNMKRHKLIHTGEKPYTCNICEKQFRSKPDVERHRLIHFREKTDKCPLCNKMFKHAELLRRHMEKHERGIPTCTVCNKQFPTNYKLQRHQATHQDNFICNVCNSTFKTSLQLQKHVETHDINEMRKLLLNMGTIKNGSPVNTTVKNEQGIAPQTKTELNQTSRKIKIQTVNSSASVSKLQQTSSGSISILGQKAGTSIIAQIPFSSSLSKITNVNQIHFKNQI